MHYSPKLTLGLGGVVYQPQYRHFNVIGWLLTGLAYSAATVGVLFAILESDIHWKAKALLSLTLPVLVYWPVAILLHFRKYMMFRCCVYESGVVIIKRGDGLHDESFVIRFSDIASIETVPVGRGNLRSDTFVIKSHDGTSVAFNSKCVADASGLADLIRSKIVAR